jgi:aldose 1-epimerase
MGRYTSTITMQEGYRVIELTDADNDASAHIVPEIGGNLLRFRSGGHDVLSSPATLAELKNDMNGQFKYGTPVLFPPNRVQNGVIDFNGRVYRLPLNEPPDHHLHGEISFRSWETIEMGASDELGAYAVNRFRFSDHPDIMDYFPHPIVFTITYRLLDGRIHLEGTIVNEGPDEAPFAFGLHPYFRLPYDREGEMVLRVPAGAEWPVTNEAFVTGRPSVTAYSRLLRDGVDISGFPALSVALVELEDADDRTCRIDVKGAGYTIAYRVDRTFPFLVLFRPDWSDAFSLEPYTYVTDAFNLPYEREITGARGIGPSESVSFATCTWVEPSTAAM